MKKAILPIIFLITLVTIVTAIPETYISGRQLSYNIIENTGELENYTIESISGFYQNGWK